MITSGDVEFVTVEVTVEFVVEQEVEMVLVEVLEDDELVSVVLVLLVVEVDEVLAVVELLLVLVELLVVEVELVVVDGGVVELDDVVAGVDEEVVVDPRLEEELEEVEFGGVRTTYAPIPATAITAMIMTATTTGAMPSLFRYTISIRGKFYLKSLGFF